MAERCELIIIGGRVYHLDIAPGEIAENILLVGDPDRVDLVARHLDRVSVDRRHREFRTITGTYRMATGTHEGMPVSVISPGIGTDNIDIAMVELYGVNEIDLVSGNKSPARPLNIIRVGTCGAIQGDIPTGALVITDLAIGFDNTGLSYDVPLDDKTAEDVESETYRLMTEATPHGSRFRGWWRPYAALPDEGLTRALKEHLPDACSGITASAGGFFGPQDRDIPGLKKTVRRLDDILRGIRVGGLRFVNREMESSALFHLARAMGYRAATVCVALKNRVTDEPPLNDLTPLIDRATTGALGALYNYQR